MVVVGAVQIVEAGTRRRAGAMVRPMKVVRVRQMGEVARAIWRAGRATWKVAV